MSATWYAFLGLSAIVGVLVAILTFALLRFGAAARNAGKSLAADQLQSALLSSALEEAIAKLKAQQRASAARAEASERLSEEIVASLTSGLLVVDRHNRVQIMNPAAERILSVRDVSLGADYRDVLRNASALAELVAESLRTNAPILRRTVTIAVESNQMALDGTMRPTRLGVSVSPLTTDATPSGAICLFTDLTDVFALEEQLRLKDSLARLGELTAGLAHEFRNGLATIHGYGRLLDPKQLPEQYGAYVEGIRSETQALGEIVTQFLNFARPDPLTLAPVDLRALVARAAEDVPSAAIRLEGEFATIEADEVLLRQAFSNLFRNSVEAAASASPSGAAPHIVVEGRMDATADVVLVSVRDDGPGIQAAALAQIFQPFFTTRAGGTGLGLAIVQKVVVSHNGRIWAGNHPDGGAVFHLSFPLKASDVATVS